MRFYREEVFDLQRANIFYVVDGEKKCYVEAHSWLALAHYKIKNSSLHTFEPPYIPLQT